MYKNIKVEAEHNELILENSHGDKVIIPANKRNWVKQKLSEGCHNCIDSLVETLPIASQYAGDGSVYPPNTKVKVNQDNQIKEYDISSPEYRDLYNSGKLMSYDKNTDTYSATPLKEVTVTAEAPQWLKDKRNLEKQYSKDWYIDNNMPKFSRSMGVSANNMHPNNVKQYDEYINNKVAESILKRNPNFDKDYENDRLKTLSNYSQKELEIIKSSNLSHKIEPSIWSKFEQGLLSVGNAGSPVTFKNENLTQEEAKKEDNPLNILQPLNIPSKMVQSSYKDGYSFTDALKGKNNNAGIVEDIVTDPLNLVGVGLAGKLSKADKVIDATKAGSRFLNKIDDVVKPIISSVDDVGKQASKQWQLEELPGLHLKSTMEGQSISKIIEPKTGLVNVEQALGIIAKESGGADKVALIRQGLGENIPKKMNYNEFRKVVQDQLIPLEKQFSEHASNYGIGKLGYPSPKRSSYEAAITHANIEKEKILQIVKEYEGYLKNPNKYKKAFSYDSVLSKTNDELLPQIKSTLDDYKQRLVDTERQISQSMEEMKLLPLENQTLMLGNKFKFGRGSSAHGNPEETLGHIHFLRDAETPDVLTVTQIQSDAFQGTHRIMPKNTPNATTLERQQKSLQKMEEIQERNKSVLNKMKTEGVDEAGLPVQDYQIKQFEDIVKAQEQSNLFKKADIENFTQKQLLDKNHQERYLQELVDYAGKRGDVNKLRVPTSETAAKVQGYTKTYSNDLQKEITKLREEKLKTASKEGIYSDKFKNLDEQIKNFELNNEKKYLPEHQTILKKYSEQPKIIKKLFGEEPKIVTDNKGNTWYEFDMPKKFKEGKGEIKAFQVIPPAIGSALYLQSQNKNKSEQ